MLRLLSFLERFSLVLLSTGVIPGGGGVLVFWDLKILSASAPADSFFFGNHAAAAAAAKLGKVIFANGFEEEYFFDSFFDGFFVLPLIHITEIVSVFYSLLGF